MGNRLLASCVREQKYSFRFYHPWRRTLLLFATFLCVVTAFSFGSNSPPPADGQAIREPAREAPRLTPDTEVLAFDAGRETHWIPARLKDLEKGQEFLFDNHLCYIDKDNHHVRHDRLDTIRVNDRFWFQGHLYETEVDRAGGPGVLFKRTAIVSSRVTKTFKSTVKTVIDLKIRHADGSEETITGTPEHPFFVEAEGGYVPLRNLEPGTVLRARDGTATAVLSTRTRHGEFEVYNIEVDGQHNYFVGTRG